MEKSKSAKMSGDAANEESGSNLPTIADDLVVTKYKMAAEITNSESQNGWIYGTMVNFWNFNIFKQLWRSRKDLTSSHYVHD